MNNNPNKLVSIKNAILDLVEDTGTESYLLMLPTLVKWGLKADLKIGSFYQYKKNIEVLAVQDCKITIPSQAVMILGIMYGNQGCSCGMIFDQIYYNYRTIVNAFDANLVFTYSESVLGYDVVDWEIQGSNIVFPYGYPDGQEMTIMFLEYETDEEGFPLVHYCNLEAITNYIKWKLCSEKVHKTFLKGGNMYADMAYQKQCKKEWNWSCSNARADLGSPTASQMNEIGELLNNPLSGKGNILLQKFSD